MILIQKAQNDTKKDRTKYVRTFSTSFYGLLGVNILIQHIDDLQDYYRQFKYTVPFYGIGQNGHVMTECLKCLFR
jgi:hypothetical protein